MGGGFPYTTIGIYKQIEHLMRFLLEDINSSVYDDKYDRPLCMFDLLEKVKVRQILDENYINLFIFMFSDIFGPNLRNQDAHGNLDDKDFNEAYILYIWWFFLSWAIKTI